MDNWEKLIKLLGRVPCKSDCENSVGACPYRKYGDCTIIDKITMCALYKLADHLIANGVTVERGNPISAFLAPMDCYKGLKKKFLVFKSDTGEMVENCFVLRPDKDPAAVAALRAYAGATDNKTLAADIINWVGEDRNEPLMLEELQQMKDEPVYLKLFNPLLTSGWHIIKAVTSDKIIYRSWQSVFTPINGLGIDYNLYRHKPKENNHVD